MGHQPHWHLESLDFGLHGSKFGKLRCDAIWHNRDRTPVSRNLPLDHLRVRRVAEVVSAQFQTNRIEIADNALKITKADDLMRSGVLAKLRRAEYIDVLISGIEPHRVLADALCD